MTVPPLRERLEDIPLLAKHFVQRACARLNCPQVRITAQQVQQLQRYHWPGNIRELQNVIERAAILARGGVLQLDLVLPAKMIDTARPHSLHARAIAASGIVREEKWRERKRQNILAALKKARGKVYGAGGAAELLGVKATTLAYRMKVLGISKGEGS